MPCFHRSTSLVAVKHLLADQPWNIPFVENLPHLCTRSVSPLPFSERDPSHRPTLVSHTKPSATPGEGPAGTPPLDPVRIHQSSVGKAGRIRAGSAGGGICPLPHPSVDGRADGMQLGWYHASHDMCVVERTHKTLAWWLKRHDTHEW